MKRFSCMLSICLMVLSFLAVTAPGQVQKIRLKVVSEQANIRLKPDIGSEMLWQVAEGTELEAEGKEGDWYLVTVDKPDGSRVRGYVHESLVEVVTSGMKPAAVVPARQPETPLLKVVEVKPKRVRPARPGYLVTLVGGGFYLSPADLNRAAQGVADYYLAELGTGKKADLNGLHLVWCYGLDFFYPLGRQLFLGLGFDYLQGARESAVSFSLDSSQYRLLTRPGLRNVSLRVSLLYQPADIFYIRAGLETNLTRASYLYRVEQDELWLEWKGRASGLNVGWSEAAGVQWPVSSWLQVYLEGAYRYSRIRNFEGHNDYLDSDGLARTEKGKLYYWVVEADGQYYPALFVRERTPTEPGVLDPRPADVNLSGFSLRVGLRLVF
ncbi:MAG: SH3 domain-containing protein [Candidatus Saccharicenans sp.]|nr:SH3 domain-containing protein [Candidatus Saccharicenans sp.]